MRKESKTKEMDYYVRVVLLIQYCSQIVGTKKNNVILGEGRGTEREDGIREVQRECRSWMGSLK